MNRPAQVFVLCTGRCGSQTFDHACRHIANFTVGHKTRGGELGPARLSFPANHIEVDNRLGWFLGRLEEAFGDDAFYVHLTRDRMETARLAPTRWNTASTAATPSTRISVPSSRTRRGR